MNHLLSGMKRLERNAAVLGQTVFLAEYLSRPPELFRRDTGLQFDGIVTFDTNSGLTKAPGWRGKKIKGKPLELEAMGSCFSRHEAHPHR